MYKWLQTLQYYKHPSCSRLETLNRLNMSSLAQPVRLSQVTATDRSMWRSLQPSAGHPQQWQCYLSRPPGPAAAGRGGLYILLLYFLSFFISFFARTYRWESAHRAPADTILTVKPPHPLLKHLTHVAPFFTGEQNVPNFGPNFDPSRLRTAVFLNTSALSENKNKLVKDRC